MKKQLLLLAMILLPLVASAHDIEVMNADDVTIYYNYINDGTELEVTFRGSNRLSNSGEYQGNVVIPEEVTYMNRTLKVTSIGEYAFYYCSALTSITIPNSVTSIGWCAFYYCSGLTSITIPNSVTSIGNEAFYGCSGLTSVTIGNSVTSIGSSAFSRCSGLTFVTIGNSVTSIGSRAFHRCSGLTSVTIPNSVTSIGSSAFDHCSGLTSVTIGNSVTSIGDYAFSGCSGLTSINIPNSVTSIGSYAFSGCSGLTSITIPANVTEIGSSVFTSCTNLTTVTLNSNPKIGTSAFPNSATVTMNLTANSAGGAYWMTFYNQNYGFEADANTQIFKAELAGAGLTLTELTTDKSVDANNAVILKSTSGTITMTLTSTASSNDFNGNSLKGVSEAAGLTAADPSTTFVLNNGAGGVGFYKLASGKKVGVGKAYLTYDGALAREFFGFEDETTAISAIEKMSNGENETYFDLQGRKVAQPTKGLYIVNGKKVVIK